MNEVVKTVWPDGPWTGEPDMVAWRDSLTGLRCMVHRGIHGALCGYVAVPPGHPSHGEEYPAIELRDFRERGFKVHGGLTYSGTCGDEPHFEPEGAESPDVWWFGIDAGHYTDDFPGRHVNPDLYAPRDAYDSLMHALLLGHAEWPTEFGYRDLPYIKNQLTNLARHLAALGE